MVSFTFSAMITRRRLRQESCKGSRYRSWPSSGATTLPPRSTERIISHSRQSDIRIMSSDTHSHGSDLTPGDEGRSSISHGWLSGLKARLGLAATQTLRDTLEHALKAD